MKFKLLSTLALAVVAMAFTSVTPAEAYNHGFYRQPHRYHACHPVRVRHFRHWR